MKRVNNRLYTRALASVRVEAMAVRQELFTSSQVGSLLEEDREYVFPESDDGFDADFDTDMDPLERE